MSIIPAALGIFLLLLISIDVLHTTMGSGGGPLTRRLTGLLWECALSANRRFRNHLFLTYSGIGITLLAVVAWIVLWWVGWTLLFSAALDSVVHADTSAPATFWERAYFTGYTVYTLGIGDFVPQGNLWRVLTVFTTMSGLFLVTFSITYLVPVVQAASQRRQLAVYIMSLGRSPVDLILNARRDDQGLSLDRHLPTIALELAGVGQRHLTYPVLHYFHTPQREEAISVSVAMLDEALTIVELGLEGGDWIDRAALLPVRSAIDEFLNSLQHAHVRPDKEAPPAPDLTRLREAGFPVADDKEFAYRVEAFGERRRRLQTFVDKDGWSWTDVGAV